MIFLLVSGWKVPSCSKWLRVLSAWFLNLHSPLILLIRWDLVAFWKVSSAVNLRFPVGYQFNLLVLLWSVVCLFLALFLFLEFECCKELWFDSIFWFFFNAGAIMFFWYQSYVDLVYVFSFACSSYSSIFYSV